MQTVISPSRGPALINPIWFVIHTAEGARTDESLASYISRVANGVSYHYLFDDDSETMCVPEGEQSWSAFGANRYGIHFCTTGFAKWSRAEWLQHSTMLDILGARLGEVSRRRGIPVANLNAAQIRTKSVRGMLGHGDYSNATGDGDHSDPGPNFPYDYVIAVANGAPAPTPTLPVDVPVDPISLEDEPMQIIQSDKRGIALIGPGYYRQLTTNEEVISATMICGAAHIDNERRFDVWVSLAIGGAGVSGVTSALTGLAASVAGVKPADVDEDVLAAAIAKYVPGVTAQQIADGVRAALAGATLTPAPQ